MTTYYTRIESPIEPLLLSTDGESLTSLTMVVQRHGPFFSEDWKRDDDAKPFAEARKQLAAYFAGELTKFDLPLAMRGTEFQKQVWRELQTIPFGVTISYGELAERVGNPNSSRAVGAANGRNPISIIVPCHRVIGANGKLTGYGGGMERKEWLLAHESKRR
ncbi:MAG: methylated-DNA--[protein]-cysteine S-methyltransferase [Acidobacteria bacterium]|nr:methylated-DNA--[protein]-cysteine S-methyltransferase [Acidobacteriota bacterium]